MIIIINFIFIIKQIQHINGVNKRRAELIDRDQKSTLTGALNQKRQESIGIDKYIWRTVKDNRVVENPSGLYPKGNAKHMNHWER